MWPGVVKEGAGETQQDLECQAEGHRLCPEDNGRV